MYSRMLDEGEETFRPSKRMGKRGLSATTNYSSCPACSEIYTGQRGLVADVHVAGAAQPRVVPGLPPIWLDDVKLMFVTKHLWPA